MKKSIKMLIALIVSLPGLGLKAQNTTKLNGVYLTENDYKNGELSYILGSHDKIQLNAFLAGKNITVFFQGKKTTFSKSEIYGLRLNNLDLRFYHNDLYKIIDTAGFMLYQRQQLTQHGKGFIPVEHYFYSVNSDQPILELTIANLWDSFPGSPEFRYSLQNYFHKDEDLASFDRAQDQYEIKYLYFQHTGPHARTIASHL